MEYKNTANQSKMMSTTMEINNHIYDTNSATFLNKICDCFANVGLLMGKNRPNQRKSDLKIYSKRCCQSFVFHEITKEKVNECINNIENYSAPGLDGITPKFIKLEKVLLAPFLTRISTSVLRNKHFQIPLK